MPTHLPFHRQLRTEIPSIHPDYQRHCPLPIPIPNCTENIFAKHEPVRRVWYLTVPYQMTYFAMFDRWRRLHIQPFVYLDRANPPILRDRRIPIPLSSVSGRGRQSDV
jgi:hypothetical protein